MPNKLHTMPLKLEALYSSLDYRSMSWDEKGAYLVLLCEAWLKGGLIEAQASVLKACLTNISDADFERIKKNVIDKKFVLDGNGFLYNETQKKIYNEIVSRGKKLSEAGRKGGLRQAQARLKAGLSKKTKPGLSIQNQNQNQNQNQINNITNTSYEVLPLTCEPTSQEDIIKNKSAKELPLWKRVKFDFEKGDWVGITKKDIEEWSIAYPACNVIFELNRMITWIKANPKKGKKKNYARFINNWLSDVQEKGGSKC